MREVTPFRVEVPGDDLDDLHRRLAATRWPEPATVDDWSQGVPLAWLQSLCSYWHDDNVMLYWLTASGASSARLYWESYRAGERPPVTVPCGCTIFPREIIRPSRRWAERDLHDIRWWDEVDRGGHFAAFEQPALFVDQLRSFFRLVR